MHRTTIVLAGMVALAPSVAYADLGISLITGGGWSSTAYRNSAHAVERLEVDYCWSLSDVMSIGIWAGTEVPFTAQVDAPSSTSWYAPLTQGGPRLGFTVSSFTLFLGGIAEWLLPQNRIGCGSCGTRVMTSAFGASAELLYNAIPHVSAGIDGRLVDAPLALHSSGPDTGNLTDSEVTLVIRAGF